MASRQLRGSFGEPKRNYVSTRPLEIRLISDLGRLRVMVVFRLALGFRRYALVWMCEYLAALLRHSN